MNAFSRRGACPALSAPMQTGDGLLVRLNPVAGGLSPNALIGLSESAQQHGNGMLEVTARGSLQIRGLTAQSAPLLAMDVDRLGIAVSTGVPVETGPLAELDPQEISNPIPLAESIREAIATSDLTARLGPKVSVVIDGGGQLTMDTVQADVRLVAVSRQSWRLAIAGDAHTSTIIGTHDEDTACEAALAILNAIAQRGIEARARDLDQEFIPAQLNTPRGDRPVGILDLGDKGNALGLGLPFGSVRADMLITLTREALALGATEIRLAQQRALLVLGLSDATCRKLQGIANNLGFITEASDARCYIAACVGAPACASGHIAARRIAEDIAREAGDVLDGTFALHVSGCAKGCAHPGVAALTLVGGENGRVGLVLSATARQTPVKHLPNDTLAQGFRRMAAALRNERRAHETTATCLARFGDARTAAFFQQG